ncbi:MAG: thiosulfate oxidation carrier protein SoxY [Burkholderiaceae bacterium]|jgi:sulfur-oxidizing protein SoxY|nr:thiosulfate oxidation carrier protein SoxY [Burkholderiaceae bacterium]
MNDQRRDFIKTAGSLGVLAAAGGLSLPAFAQQGAWNKAAFEAKNLQEVLKSLGGATATESKDIAITAPDIAENGAVVPIGVTSKVPGTQGVYILVDKNPNALAASFAIPQGTEANVATRIKMGQTSNVLALVKANNQFYVTTKEVKVTLGGCGG